MQCIEGPSASEEAGCSIMHHNHACGRGTQRYRNAAGSPFSLRHAFATFACLLTPLLTHARGKMLRIVLDRAKLQCDRIREPPPRAPLGDELPALSRQRRRSLPNLCVQPQSCPRAKLPFPVPHCLSWHMSTKHDDYSLRARYSLRPLCWLLVRKKCSSSQPEL